jgi:hypothetical protein
MNDIKMIQEKEKSLIDFDAIQNCGLRWHQEDCLYLYSGKQLETLGSWKTEVACMVFAPALMRVKSDLQLPKDCVILSSAPHVFDEVDESGCAHAIEPCAYCQRAVP